MKIAVIDDEKMELSYLSEAIRGYLSEAGYLENRVDTFQSAEEFFGVWEVQGYDLILMDIYMDGLSGIDAARRIRRLDADVRLVFCTISNGFASESYEVGAHYYLQKPVSKQRISDMFKRLKMEEYETGRFVILPDGQHMVLRNIIYTEYGNHIVTVYNKKGEDIRTRITQTEFEKLICEYPYFWRCAKGIVVNFYEVEEFGGHFFEMSNGKKVYMSRRREKEVQKAYMEFCFEQTRREIGG
ncbi:response regulator [Lachnospiraceae bacterium WCA-9-b2]|jgi:DNA-binding LytR/AlgR family response regulator|uniref:Stage 0 sporulation protein A homolog n=1 Tax=Sporofaciens musculi TaxID=2681861 RepID=A0A7X3SJT4_9FIRM|nr:LytTR family DNA-binding domain-containing protein [Sporofaciens musculi]MXP76779.1 response regulator [Sporofaciens musculi]